MDDANRTFDFPFDEMWTVSASYGSVEQQSFAYAIGASLIYGGDADIDQTSQGLRVKGNFDYT